MALSLKNYTFKTISVVLLAVITIWAGIFYAFILDEVYDTVDDGLENQKVEIIRTAYNDEEMLGTRAYGVNMFRITPIDNSAYFYENIFDSENLQMPHDDEEEPYRILKTCFRDRHGNVYLLEIASSSLEQDELFYDLFTALVVLYIAILLSVFLINQVLFLRAFRPFKRVLDFMSNYRFGEGKRDVSLDRGRVTEFNQLAYQVERMIDRNQETFTQQREFLENASHELQTPLAIMQNKLDWMIEQEEMTESQLMQLAEIKQTLMRMSTLNRSLLMLSKIENHQFQDEEEVVVNEIADELKEEYEDFFEFKELTSILKSEGTFQLKANKELIKVLISNLIRNAVRYTERGGEVLLHIREDELVVANTAINDSPLNGDNIFRRFYKNSQDQKASGLGLSIVSSIVRQYPLLSIRYEFKNHYHCFILSK